MSTAQAPRDQDICSFRRGDVDLGLRLAGGLGLQYIGDLPAAGEIVSLVGCELRPDHSPDWAWPPVS